MDWHCSEMVDSHQMGFIWPSVPTSKGDNQNRWKVPNNGKWQVRLNLHADIKFLWLILSPCPWHSPGTTVDNRTSLRLETLEEHQQLLWLHKEQATVGRIQEVQEFHEWIVSNVFLQCPFHVKYLNEIPYLRLMVVQLPLFHLKKCMISRFPFQVKNVVVIALTASFSCSICNESLCVMRASSAVEPLSLHKYGHSSYIYIYIYRSNK